MKDCTFSINDVKPEDMDDVNNLLQLLSPGSDKITHEWQRSLWHEGYTFVCRNQNSRIVGMASLTLVKKQLAYFGTCEDVVVDENYRRRGIGKTLMRMLLETGKSLDLKYIELTSNSKRVAANKLYQSLGLNIKTTNIYTTLSQKPKVRLVKNIYTFKNVLYQILSGELRTSNGGAKILESAWICGCTPKKIEELKKCYFFKEGGNTGTVYDSGRVDLQDEFESLEWSSRSGNEPEVYELSDGILSFRFDSDGVLIDHKNKKIFIAPIKGTQQFESSEEYLKRMV